MFIVAIAVLVAITEIQAAAAVCDKRGYLVYEDLGCKPVRGTPSDACPISYDCRHFHDFGPHCYYQGQKYPLDERLPSNVTEPSCNTGCVCGISGRITCAVLDCPEWLGAIPPKKDCHLSYDLDKCCSVGQVCGPDKEDVKCEVDGQVYHKGQKFYPKGTCSVCVCQKGFSGKYEAPYCRPINCGTELKYRKFLEGHCAPVYENKPDLCCPHFWTCLSEGDFVNPAETPSESREICIFGNKRLKVGEYIEKTDEKYGRRHSMHCECSFPPLLTCIIKKSEPSTNIL